MLKLGKGNRLYGKSAIHSFWGNIFLIYLVPIWGFFYLLVRENESISPKLLLITAFCATYFDSSHLIASFYRLTVNKKIPKHFKINYFLLGIGLFLFFYFTASSSWFLFSTLLFIYSLFFHFIRQSSGVYSLYRSKENDEIFKSKPYLRTMEKAFVYISLIIPFINLHKPEVIKDIWFIYLTVSDTTVDILVYISFSIVLILFIAGVFLVYKNKVKFNYRKINYYLFAILPLSVSTLFINDLLYFQIVVMSQHVLVHFFLVWMMDKNNSESKFIKKLFHFVIIFALGILIIEHFQYYYYKIDIRFLNSFFLYTDQHISFSAIFALSMYRTFGLLHQLVDATIWKKKYLE